MSLFEIAAIAATGIAAFYDWRTGHIPNWLSVGTAVFGVVARGLALGISRGSWLAGVSGAGAAVIAGLIAGAVPFLLFRARAMGGGDVKLFSALGTLCLVSGAVTAEAYSFSCALLSVMLVTAYRGTLWRTLRRSVGVIRRPPASTRCEPSQVTTLATTADDQTWFRLGPSIFAGTVAMCLTRFCGL